MPWVLQGAGSAPQLGSCCCPCARNANPVSQCLLMFSCCCRAAVVLFHLRFRFWPCLLFRWLPDKSPPKDPQSPNPHPPINRTSRTMFWHLAHLFFLFDVSRFFFSPFAFVFLLTPARIPWQCNKLRKNWKNRILAAPPFPITVATSSTVGLALNVCLVIKRLGLILFL